VSRRDLYRRWHVMHDALRRMYKAHKIPLFYRSTLLSSDPINASGLGDRFYGITIAADGRVFVWTGPPGRPLSLDKVLYTTAHELAHALLHIGKYPRPVSKKRRKQEEREADGVARLLFDRFDIPCPPIKKHRSFSKNWKVKRVVKDIVRGVK
jgi:hypothetical protein